jgi:hypothetical protein
MCWLRSRLQVLGAIFDSKLSFLSLLPEVPLLSLIFSCTSGKIAEKERKISLIQKFLNYLLFLIMKWHKFWNSIFEQNFLEAIVCAINSSIVRSI